ncbi:MAG: acyltransferase [Rothia sp. (in: high G+C Gram-positive bacteria)]|uniref:acyltransferase family protein n=1 Tax=Rothia sp. (in: high G+C Gram-positive bacteria) TaxID=1885016 RepID=UPI0026DF28AE|nr:acyltransferase [Rothia sp. (in: high G+C Gram-positive bacteria)]MDO5750276.1 acyltransferase [Rothia sp. (in: high G+C Gram-positive bacteria)]
MTVHQNTRRTGGNEVLDNSFITPGRFRELDGLRGIAAITVVLYHFGMPAGGAPGPYDISWGELGVQLFFIISGYVILLTAIKSANALSFVISRFSRLYPTYWLALALAAGTYFLYGNPHRNITAMQTLVNTTMFQRFFLVDNVDQVYWTLAVELQFYALMTVYLLFRRGTVYRRELVVGMLIWVFMGSILCVVFHPEAALSGVPKMLVWAVVAEHAPLFSLGMVLFMYSHDRRFTLLIPLFSLVASLNAWLMHDAVHGIGVALICVAFFAVIYVKNVPWLAHGPLNFLGQISYPLYLNHEMFGYMLIDIFVPVLGVWGGRVLALVIVILWAYLMHRTVETRLSSALRKSLQGKLVKS